MSTLRWTCPLCKVWATSALGLKQHCEGSAHSRRRTIEGQHTNADDISAGLRTLSSYFRKHVGLLGCATIGDLSETIGMTEDLVEKVVSNGLTADGYPYFIVTMWDHNGHLEARKDWAVRKASDVKCFECVHLGDECCKPARVSPGMLYKESMSHNTQDIESVPEVFKRKACVTESTEAPSPVSLVSPPPAALNRSKGSELSLSAAVFPRNFMEWAPTAVSMDFKDFVSFVHLWMLMHNDFYNPSEEYAAWVAALIYHYADEPSSERLFCPHHVPELLKDLCDDGFEMFTMTSRLATRETWCKFFHVVRRNAGGDGF